MSSDSSDEENLDLLVEAVDSQFINDSMFTKVSDKTKEVCLEPKPISLRHNKDGNEEFNKFRVTPQFQQYVAKRLLKILEDKLESQLYENNTEVSRSKPKGGIKLFSVSKKFVKVRNGGKVLCRRKREVKTRKIKSEVSKQLNLGCVAVSSDEILSMKEVKNWSKRSKAQVFLYKKSKNGDFVNVQPEFK